MLTARNKDCVCTGTADRGSQLVYIGLSEPDKKGDYYLTERLIKSVRLKKNQKNSWPTRMGELAVCGPAFHLAFFERGVIVT